MQRMLLFTAVLAALVLGACAPAAPTVDPAQIQASAIAAAGTMIALTQAAIPTATPPPPTPLPSPTLLVLPTLGPLPTLQNQPTATTASSGGGDCNQLLDVGAAGPKAPLVIQNTTKGPVTFSMGFNRKNTFGQCGYMSWANIPKANSISVSVPMIHTNMGDACYWAYAWVNDPKKPTTVSGGGFCIDNQLKWTIAVSYDKIKITPP